MRQFRAVVDRVGLATESRRRREEKISVTPRLRGEKLAAPTVLATPHFSQRISHTSQINQERNWIELTASESSTSVS